MQIRKIYKDLKPDLLYDVVRDFIIKQGATLSNSKFDTYSIPTDSSSFISRGTLTFKSKVKASDSEKDCITAHIVGSARGETKLLLDIDEKLFTGDRLPALQEDLDFIFSSYEIKRH